MGDVVVAWPCGRFIDAGFAQCLSALQVHDAAGPGRIADVISLISSPRIASTRNNLVKAFLALGGEWMLMLDADMAFPPDTIDRLLEVADADERPIVSGLYFGGKPEGPAMAHAYVLAEGTDSAFNPVEGVTGPGEWEGCGRVNMVGAGCLLVHRGVLEAVGDQYAPTGHPWFAEAVRDGEEVGEDVVFCMRAEACGFPIHCLFDLICGHIKTGIVDERTHQQFLALTNTGWSEEEVAEDYGSRFRYSGFRNLESQNRTRKSAEVVARAQSKVDSLLGVNGEKPG